MRYSEIAEEMGCTEFGARKLFCRAKKMLAKQLARRGLGRGSLLVALALFGKTTATSEAAAANISLTASTVKAGLAASLAAMATTKTMVISLATVGVVATGSVVIGPSMNKASLPPHQSKAQNLIDAPQQSKASSRDSECWYYYPPRANGVVMMRLMDGREPSYCQWLQSDQANHYKRNGAIYIENYRMWNSDLSVRRLPTDPPQLREFLSRVEGRTDSMQYVPGNGGGLLVVLKHDEDGACSQINRHYDISDEEFFRYNWPAGADVVDNRDPMHKRGWTYFTVAGRINGEDVSGTGRIPFVYATSKKHAPWLKLKVGNDLKITDSGTGAYVQNAGGKILARYEGGCFFRGLSRPWMGLHTIDTVRRDAAEKQVWFQTVQGRRKEEIEVVLTCGQTKMVYSIDMKADLVEAITFSTNDRSIGELKLSYLQEIDSATEGFAAPVARSSAGSWQGQTGLSWLKRLAEGKLKGG